MMRTKLPRTQTPGMAPGDYPFRIPSASAPDRSPPLAPPTSWAWNELANGMPIGPSTLGGLRLLAKRPRRRRRERLQGFNGPFEITIPAKPDHRLDDKNRPLKTTRQTVINDNQIPMNWPV